MVSLRSGRTGAASVAAVAAGTSAGARRATKAAASLDALRFSSKRARVEVAYEVDDDTKAPEAEKEALKVVQQGTAKKSGGPLPPLTRAFQPHKNWAAAWDAIATMRASKSAPVDAMGAEELGDESGSPEVFRFQTLVALMLSSQTKDEITAMAVRQLQKLPGGLTVDSVIASDEATLQQAIYPAGFYRNKAKYLKQAAIILQRDFHGDIPDTVDGLCSLPGVGPKMAFLAMQIAWDKPVGIGVDVHVHRISNRLRWAKSKAPEETRVQLESWLPKDRWGKINLMLVGFGQQICLPRGPRCDQCLAKDVCPSAFKAK